MKREGKQHGLVRTYRILPSNPLDPPTRLAEKKASPPLGSPPTAGVFSKVPTKPTNHSKFTGKGGRHLHPAWKSKDKIKGARAKLRSSGLDLGQGGLLALRVTGPSFYKVKLDSQSASDILDELCSPQYEFDEFGDNIYTVDYDYKYSLNRYDDHPIVEEPRINLDCLGEYPFLPGPIYRVSSDEVEDRVGSIQFGVGEYDDNGDDDMGFFDVAIVWEAIDGDEGWSIVGEM